MSTHRCVPSAAHSLRVGFGDNQSVHHREATERLLRMQLACRELAEELAEARRHVHRIEAELARIKRPSPRDGGGPLVGAGTTNSAT